MSDDLDLSEHAARTRAQWNAAAPTYLDFARRRWSRTEPDWGMWDVPETEIRALPDVRDRDVIDLGCGTGYWCAWLKRLGARPVGLDVAEAQLDTARAMQREFGLEFPLVHGTAEAPPFPDGAFDVAFSEYGAAIWCDPYVWIPEAFRLLRPGGRLVFLGNSALAMLCAPPADEPAGEVLLRPLLGLRRIDWADTGETTFHLPHGEMLRHLRATGFEVEALHELRAADGDEDEVRYYIRRGWAMRWPCEEVWVARRPI